MLNSSLWWTALGVTVFITVVSVVVELAIGMGMALIMRYALVGRGLVRTAILIPYGIVTVVAAYSWQYAWTPVTGYLANLLPSGSAPLTEQWPAIFIIILAEVWKTTPFMALLLLSGLTLIPDNLLRAAKVDGASKWQRFTQVMLPLMKPTILVALLFRTLDAFRIFDNIYILTAGANNTPWGARNWSVVMLRVRIRGSGRRGHRGGGSAWRLAVPLCLGALTTRAPTGRGCGGDDGGCSAGRSCGGREGGGGAR